MTPLEALKDHVSQLREWADGNRLGGGMGSGLHAEKWPSLTPGARGALAEHVTWLEQSLAELEAAQHWRPMSEAPTYRKDIDGFVRDEPVMLLFDGGQRSIGHLPRPNTKWHCWASGYAFAGAPLGWLPLPEPPKEGT